MAIPSATADPRRAAGAIDAIDSTSATSAAGSAALPSSTRTAAFIAFLIFDHRGGGNISGGAPAPSVRSRTNLVFVGARTRVARGPILRRHPQETSMNAVLRSALAAAGLAFATQAAAQIV